MRKMIQAFCNTEFRSADPIPGFSQLKADQVRAFHRSVPGYAETQLANLMCLAKELGLGEIRVKDESSRFGLNAFKSLGGLWCTARCMQHAFALPEPLTFPRLLEIPPDERAARLFVTATDGNHGRGVAFAARMLGARAIVYMPKGSAPERVDNIRKQGAEVLVTDVDYDDTVRMAAEAATQRGGLLIQDTTDQEESGICRQIMEGYLTLGDEIREAMDQPTHIFLQAGVGSMAAALCAYFRSVYGSAPVISVVEAGAADCLYQTAKAHDANMHRTKGSMQTMMAGLCCGEPCRMAMRMLEKQADWFLTVEDQAAVLGMRTLASPPGNDPKIVSGESGAASTGLLVQLMRDPEQKALREKMGLGSHSRVLLLSTEGATDRENYARVVGATV